MDNALFIQFYTYEKDYDRYELFNGFSDTWDFCERRGRMVWVYEEYLSDKIPELNMKFEEGTVYVSCTFSSHLNAVYDWSKKNPNIEFVIGGPIVKFVDIENPIGNIIVYKGTVEELFGIEPYSYDWKIDVPEELKKKTMTAMRYNYSLTTACYWNKCIFCRLNVDSSDRTRPVKQFKKRMRKKTNAVKEIIALANPALTNDIMEKFIVPVELDEDMWIRTYMRPDKKSYLMCKEWLPKMDNIQKVFFILGIEFPSKRMLRKMNKGTTIQIIKDMMKLLNDYKCRYNVNFIVGWPDLMEEDLESLQELMHIFNPYKIAFISILKVNKDGTPLSNIYPPPENKDVWFPIANADKKTFELNLEALRTIENYFHIIMHQHPNKKFMDDLYREKYGDVSAGMIC